MIVFIDDQWVSDTEATINIKDIGILRGFGIFDYLRTYGTNPFRLTDHIDRFYNSSHLLGITPKYSKERIAQIIHEGIIKNGFVHTNIKFIQTGGISPDGFMPAEMGTFFVYFYEAKEYPQEMYETGTKLKTSPLMRQYVEAKTVNYAASIAEVRKAMIEGFQDIIHTDQNGDLYEATRSNLFGIREGKLITTDQGVLFGVTRKVVLEIARALAIDVEYRCMNLSELRTLDEVFTTNSSQEVMPVLQINDIRIGDGKVGALTKLLHKEFKKLTTVV